MFSSSRRNTNIFIGNLKYSTTEDTLRNYFEKFGYVKEVNIIRNEIGQSRGFGFVKQFFIYSNALN
jgi:RNA recognition motif-containing protein